MPGAEGSHRSPTARIVLAAPGLLRTTGSLALSRQPPAGTGPLWMVPPRAAVRSARPVSPWPEPSGSSARLCRFRPQIRAARTWQVFFSGKRQDEGRMGVTRERAGQAVAVAAPAEPAGTAARPRRAGGCAGRGGGAAERRAGRHWECRVRRLGHSNRSPSPGRALDVSVTHETLKARSQRRESGQ